MKHDSPTAEVIGAGGTRSIEQGSLLECASSPESRPPSSAVFLTQPSGPIIPVP